jgi:hypothetical protein
LAPDLGAALMRNVNRRFADNGGCHHATTHVQQVFRGVARVWTILVVTRGPASVTLHSATH